MSKMLNVSQRVGWAARAWWMRLTRRPGWERMPRHKRGYAWWYAGRAVRVYVAEPVRVGDRLGLNALGCHKEPLYFGSWLQAAEDGAPGQTISAIDVSMDRE